MRRRRGGRERRRSTRRHLDIDLYGRRHAGRDGCIRSREARRHRVRRQDGRRKGVRSTEDRHLHRNRIAAAIDCLLRDDARTLDEGRDLRLRDITRHHHVLDRRLRVDVDALDHLSELTVSVHDGSTAGEHARLNSIDGVRRGHARALYRDLAVAAPVHPRARRKGAGCRDDHERHGHQAGHEQLGNMSSHLTSSSVPLGTLFYLIPRAYTRKLKISPKKIKILCYVNYFYFSCNHSDFVARRKSWVSCSFGSLWSWMMA